MPRPARRLVRNDAGAGGTRVWLTSANCCARLGGHRSSTAAPLSHLAGRPRRRAGAGRDRGDRPRLQAGLVAGIAPTISKAPALKCLRRAQHINVGYDVSNADITGLAGWVLAVRIRRARVRWRGSSTTVRADPIKVLTTRDAVASVTSRSKTRSTPRYPPYGVIPRQAERIRRRSRMPSSIPSRSSRKRSSTGGRFGRRSCAHRTGRCFLDFAASPHLHDRRRFSSYASPSDNCISP